LIFHGQITGGIWRLYHRLYFSFFFNFNLLGDV
jgi:hypothetical protein